MNSRKMPTLASIVTPFPYQIDCMASLQAAQELMQQHEIRHLIVMRDNDFYSLLSRHDLNRHAAVYEADRLQGLTVNDLCVERVVCADINDPLDKVLDSMAEKHLGSVVVMREGELAGIVTTTDICEHFAQHLRESYKGEPIPDITA